MTYQVLTRDQHFKSSRNVPTPEVRRRWEIIPKANIFTPAGATWTSNAKPTWVRLLMVV